MLKRGLPRFFRWSVETESQHSFAPARAIVDPERIDALLERTRDRARDASAVRDILQKARERALLPAGRAKPSRSHDDHDEYVQGLDLEEAATLIQIDTAAPSAPLQELYDTALEIKRAIYGNRIVLFAPLYLANYCVNSCTYCAFRGANKHVERSMLGRDELIEEVRALQRQGHRRLLVLTGEHPRYTFDMLLDALKTIKDVRSDPCGAIRRMNVEIPALSVSDFRRLKALDCVGTYTLFQESYDPRTYRRFHPTGPKADYEHRLQTMDRAQTAGIDDVGIGALFGLTDYRFEVLGLLSHAQHLDRTFRAGPHTISIPRLRPADSAPDAITPPAPVSDADFKKLVAVLRCAVPYTGMILSTRESPATRAELLHLGISQMSAGSKTDVGSYHKERMQAEVDPASGREREAGAAPAPGPGGGGSLAQFELLDHRSVDEVIAELMKDGYLPSFCTACYRKSRTGEAFMNVAKTGRIQDFCHPNSLLTLQEYLQDYASDSTRRAGEALIDREMNTLSESARRALDKKLDRTRKGERDLFF